MKPQLAIIEQSPDGTVHLLHLIAEGDKDFWQAQFETARAAIAFQSTMTELESFNALHLNLLLRHSIQAGILKQQSISLEPLIRKVVEKEVAKTSWRLSRRKKLMHRFEKQYQVLSGTFQSSLFNRMGTEAFLSIKQWLQQKLPIHLK